MAAAWVGDRLVQEAGHYCCPAALTMGAQSMPGDKLHLQLPIPLCVLTAWCLGRRRAMSMHSHARHSGLLILVGTSQVYKERKYLNRETRWKEYSSTLCKEIKKAGMWYL